MTHSMQIPIQFRPSFKIRHGHHFKNFRNIKYILRLITVRFKPLCHYLIPWAQGHNMITPCLEFGVYSTHPFLSATELGWTQLHVVHIDLKESCLITTTSTILPIGGRQRFEPLVRVTRLTKPWSMWKFFFLNYPYKISLQGVGCLGITDNTSDHPSMEYFCSNFTIPEVLF